MSRARPPDHLTASSAGYLNDPGRGVGLGAFGMYVAYGSPPWRYWDTSWGDPRPPNTAWCIGSRRIGDPGVAWVSSPEFGDRWYEQGLALLEGDAIVRVRWTFTDQSARLDATLRFVKDPGCWVKEPEFGFGFDAGSSVKAIETPGTSCPIYHGLTDPARRTGRCEDPDRRRIVLRGPRTVRLAVSDLPWRQIADAMRGWRPAGQQECPGYTKRRIHDNWEYPARAPFGKSANPDVPYDSLVALIKGQEGCVSGLDFSYGYRRPPGPAGPFKLSVTIS